MHECPNCGQACDCIGDDTWNDLEALECECQCEFLEDNMDDDFYDEDCYDDWHSCCDNVAANAIHWGVDVRFNHETILTIESNCLSGKSELSDEEKEAIREAARHLLAFIGDDETTNPKETP
jgi:hypothetical protein